MGLYFNPNHESFKKATGSRIYIDKSMLMQEMNFLINDEKNCVVLSHARRFGKSQAAGMIDAYYSKGCDSRGLFENLKLAQTENWDKYLNKLNVIHLDMSTIAGSHKEDLVDYTMDTIYEELSEDYPHIKYTADIAKVLDKVYKISGTKFVIIIDEWDYAIRNQSDRQDLVHRYMQFLHDIFKSEESKSFLALGYITGIVPIKKIRDESALNNFREFTMLDSGKITKYFGFTEDEVKELCKKYNMNFASVNKWYNGYLINGLHMYNPNSVYQSMLDEQLKSYWKNTSAFDTINTYIAMNYAGLREDILTMLAGGRVDVKTNTFQNDLSEIHSKDDALTALIHLGYLGYDAEEKEAYIPNYEVATAYEAALEVGGWHEVADSISKCDSLLKATIRGQADKVAQIIDLAHTAYSSLLKYNNENSLSCILTMAYFTAPAYYDIKRELPAGKGFADLAFVPRRDSGNKPAMIVELKWDKDADTAIKQIKEKRYAESLKGYADKILLVGINYDKDTKKHECVIEEYMM